MAGRTEMEIATQQIQFARTYTLGLLEDIPEEDWFRMPSGLHTHIAWQVGHLAMAEYGLCLFRQRGRAEIDTELMSSAFRKKFSKGTVPNPDPAENPSVAEIREVLSRVHQQALLELEGFDDASRQETIDMPYSVHANQLGALYFCAAHEMLHAGQIGVLRRGLGRDPVR